MEKSEAALIISILTLFVVIYQFYKNQSNRKLEIINESCILATTLDVKVRKFEEYLYANEGDFESSYVKMMSSYFAKSGMSVDRIMDHSVDIRKFKLSAAYRMQNELLRINRLVQYHGGLIETKIQSSS